MGMSDVCLSHYSNLEVDNLFHGMLGSQVVKIFALRWIIPWVSLHNKYCINKYM